MGKLGTVSFNVENPVVQLIDADTSEVIYTVRVKGKSFTPHAPNGKNLILKAGVNAADVLVYSGVTTQSAKNKTINL